MSAGGPKISHAVASPIVWRCWCASLETASGLRRTISSFTPRYGQGVSVAALQALELQRVLATHTSNLASEFFGRAAKVVENPWGMSASKNDLRMKEVRRRRNAASTLINWYMARLQKAAHRDPSLALAFHRVTNLLAPLRVS